MAIKTTVISNLNDAGPAPKEDYDNIEWQIDRTTLPPNISACIPRATTERYGTIIYDASGSPSKYLGADKNWHDFPSSLPTGGAAGQVLVKLSGTNYHVGWDDPEAGLKPPVQLTNNAILVTDASLGNMFYVTITGNRTLANPTNCAHLQSIMWLIRQDSTGGHDVIFSSKFKFHNADPNGVLKFDDSINGRTYIGAIYDQTSDTFDILAFDSNRI